MSELEQYFKYKCQKGLKNRGLADKQNYIDRLDFEMNTILKMGFPGYFLIVQDFMEWSRANNILVGPGRGSAAGSLVSYSLGITNLDPIRWNLLFERFLNPDRISMPDIDIDIEKRFRDKVIEYVIEKFGADKVAHIGTFNMMRAKAAVRSVTRTLGHPYEVGDKISKLLLPPIHGKPQPLEQSIKQVAELQSYVSHGGTYAEILDWAGKVEDLISSVGVHASGIVISNEPLMDKVPLFRGRGGEITTQWEMNNIEEVGLIKFDFLGLDALTKIHRCIDIVKRTKDVEIDIDAIDIEDEAVFTNLRGGDNIGIFQLEGSSGMRDLLVQIRPTSVEDLIALVAIYRPGPLCLSGDTLILTNIFHGKEKTQYRYETLKSLYDTYQSKLITKRRSRSIRSMDENYRLISNQIKAVHKSGIKPVYRIEVQTQLTNNYSPSITKPMRRTDQIKASLDHQFLTISGDLIMWKTLNQLRVGDYLAINYRGHFGAQRAKDVYGRKNFRNIAFRHYQYRCVMCDWDKGSLDVNHINGNRNTDNSAENLCFLCPNHHREYTEGRLCKDTLLSERERWKLPISNDIMFVRYVDKHLVGEEETYDIEMQSPYNNFVAGDFVVHNSSTYKDTYLNVRAGIQEPEYLVPELAPILERTSGWLIYQEQILEIAKQLCGYTGGEADELRKAVGKKKQKLMDKHEPKFKKGWVDHGLPAAAADQLWNDMVGFASYAFNRSHAAAYAMITYQTAWLKTHYPTEFMCAVMISEGGDKDDMIKCLTECKRLGIQVLPPDINSSWDSFFVESEGVIRFGLGPVKNLGESPVQALIAERDTNGPFKSLRDFCERVDLGVVNRLKLESLIKAGAFDGFGLNRQTMLDMVEPIWEYRKQMRVYEKKLDTFFRKRTAYEQRLQDVEEGKLSETGKKLKPFKEPERPELPQWPETEIKSEMQQLDLISAEHELLGFYVSSHPLDGIDQTDYARVFSTIEDLKGMSAKTPVSVAAVITNKNEITTRKKKKMAFLSLEDLTGSIESVCFPRIYERTKFLLNETRPLRIEGTVEVTEADDGRVTKLVVRDLSVLDIEIENKPEKLKVIVDAMRARDLKDTLKKFAGDHHEVEVSLKLQDGTLVRFKEDVRIGDYKAEFMRDIVRINNGEQTS